jgi:peptidoglycan/LPS O-acetylase OafA/YrhL
MVCVTVTCLLGALFISPDAQWGAMEGGIFALFGLSNIYFFREATNYFCSSAQLNLFTHTWSLGVEEQFYVVFPALLWICGGLWGRRRGGRSSSHCLIREAQCAPDKAKRNGSWVPS